jgi:hypothetical protein
MVSGGGGIIIYIRDNFSYHIVSSVSHTSGFWEALIVSITSPQCASLQIVCMYRTPGKMNADSLKEFIDYFCAASVLNNDFHTVLLFLATLISLKSIGNSTFLATIVTLLRNIFYPP